MQQLLCPPSLPTLQPPSPTHSIVFTFSPIISQTVVPTIPIVITTTPSMGPSSSQSIRPAMAARYAPLVLPDQLNAMPIDYQYKILTFDNIGSHTSQQHVDIMNDVFDLHEVVEADVKMRLFAQSLGGDVKKWFRSLPAGSIAFHQTLLARWEIKKNPLQLLNGYKRLKKKTNETVEEYCEWFNTVYNAIPIDIKTSLGLALIDFLDGFDVNMEYQIRERPCHFRRNASQCYKS